MRLPLPARYLPALLLSLGLFGCNTELKRAREALKNNDIQQALQLYEKVVKKDPDNEAGLRELTAIACEKIKGNKCFTYASKLHKKFPSDAKVKDWYKNAVLDSAKALYMEQRFQAATERLQEFSKFDKENGLVFFFLANMKIRQNAQTTDKTILMEAVADYEKAIKYSKPTDTVAQFSEKRENLVHWESYVQMGSIYERLLNSELLKFMQDEEKRKASAPKEAPKKGKKGKKKAEGEEGPKFQPTKEYLDKALAAYESASKLNIADRAKNWLPFFKIGLIYAQFGGDREKGIEWMTKAYNFDQNNFSVVANIKMVYDQMAEKAEADGDKDKKAEYEKKSQEFSSKADSLQGNK